MTKEAIVAKRTPPYIEEEFNSSGLFMNTFNNVRCVPARFFNLIIEALNKKPKLPKYIVIVPDEDIVRYNNLYEGSDAVKCTHKVLKYLVKEINKYVDARFEDLYRRKPGSVNKGEPKIIWLKNAGETSRLR